MSAEQLWETTLNPDTRRLLPVHLGAFDFVADREPDHQADGQGRSRRPPRTDGTARRRRGNRYLSHTPCMTAANFAATSPDRTTARVRLRPTMTSDLEYVLSLEQDPENLRVHHALGAHPARGGDPLPGFPPLHHRRRARARRGRLPDPDRLPQPEPVARAQAHGGAGQGLRASGRAALRVAKKVAFDDLGAHRFWLDVKARNSRAKALYDSEGFVVEGELREAVKVAGRLRLADRHVDAAARIHRPAQPGPGAARMNAAARLASWLAGALLASPLAGARTRRSGAMSTTRASRISPPRRSTSATSCSSAAARVSTPSRGVASAARPSRRCPTAPARS